MKRPAKFLAILSAVSMSVSLLVPTLTASADAASALPFDLEAPTNVAMKYLNGDDSPNTIQIVYSQNNSMSEFFSDKDNNYDQWLAELNAEGYDDMWVTAQIDWSIDSAEDWHYNEYWDTEGYDEDYHMRLGEWAFISCAYSCEQSMSEYIFRFGYDIDDPDDRYWTGSHEGSDDYDGWKDVLEGKYDEVKIDGVNCAKIDLDKHTIYARVRWLVTYDLPDEGGRHTLGSEWSEAAAIGKDAEGSELSTEAAKAAPVIKDLRVTDEEFNDYPIVAFTLDVPEELTAMLAQLELEGGDVWLETFARVQGKEDWVQLDGDWVIKSGEMKMYLQALAEAEGSVDAETPIELRCRYRTFTNDVEIESDWSETLTFGSLEMTVSPEEEVSETTAEEPSSLEETAPAVTSSTAEAQEEKSSFPWWLIILLLIIVIIIIIIVLKKKKDEEQK